MSYIENLREEDSATFSAISGCGDVIDEALLLSREICQTQTGALGNFNSDGKPMVTDKLIFELLFVILLAFCGLNNSSKSVPF